jgi:hypothetical protein
MYKKLFSALLTITFCFTFFFSQPTLTLAQDGKAEVPFLNSIPKDFKKGKDKNKKKPKYSIKMITPDDLVDPRDVQEFERAVSSLNNQFLVVSELNLVDLRERLRKYETVFDLGSKVGKNTVDFAPGYTLALKLCGQKLVESLKSIKIPDQAAFLNIQAELDAIFRKLNRDANPGLSIDIYRNLMMEEERRLKNMIEQRDALEKAREEKNKILQRMLDDLKDPSMPK